MKSFYQCKRCEYKTENFADIKRHLKRKFKCEWKSEKNNNLSDLEIYNQSICKKYDNFDDIIKKYNERKEELKNKDINWKEANITCDYCEKKFANRSNLERHENSCKSKMIINKTNNNFNTNTNQNITINQNTTNNANIINNNFIQNQNFNITVNFDSESVQRILLPFYEKFDTSHISDDTKFDLLLSALYEDTLKEILKNEINLNFCIESNDDNKSIIYHEDQLKRINNEEIYEIIWDKIKNYLIETLIYLQTIKTKYDKDMLRTLEEKIKIKHNYFNGKNAEIRTEVRNIIKRCSDENKTKILLGFEKIENNNNLIGNI